MCGAFLQKKGVRASKRKPLMGQSPHLSLGNRCHIDGCFGRRRGPLLTWTGHPQVLYSYQPEFHVPFTQANDMIAGPTRQSEWRTGSHRLPRPYVPEGPTHRHRRTLGAYEIRPRQSEELRLAFRVHRTGKCTPRIVKKLC